MIEREMSIHTCLVITKYIFIPCPNTYRLVCSPPARGQSSLSHTIKRIFSPCRTSLSLGIWISTITIGPQATQLLDLIPSPSFSDLWMIAVAARTAIISCSLGSLSVTAHQALSRLHRIPLFINRHINLLVHKRVAFLDTAFGQILRVKAFHHKYVVQVVLVELVAGPVAFEEAPNEAVVVFGVRVESFNRRFRGWFNNFGTSRRPELFRC